MQFMKELKDIESYYTTKLVKEASKDKFDLTGKIKDIIDAGTKLTNFGFKYVGAPVLLGIPASAVTLGTMASKVGSPEALAKNADKYVLRSALDAEIATMERKIADRMLRRNTVDSKKYDRFV